MPLLFVYGTLKRGFPLHHHLAEARFVAAARTGPGFTLYQLDWYPAMVADPEGAGVSGELFEVPDSLFPVLDEVEGAPHRYHRLPVAIVERDRLPTAEQALAYVYRQPVLGRARIESGEWS
jgi:gamma-glutamylcyclotransferase (GGCT)/AIG2-like uncharacterized protein YtfP